MAWDEWEQLKKQAAVRAEGGLDRATDVPRQDGDEESRIGTEPTPSVTGELDPYEAARRMERIRHTIDRFRYTTVLVPLAPLDDGGRGFLTADFGGVRWIHAFTDESAAGRFDETHDGPKDRRDFMALRGWRLLDVVVPAMGVPCGVALDVGSGDDGVLLPPVAGIVPDEAAVDVRANGKGERAW